MGVRTTASAIFVLLCLSGCELDDSGEADTGNVALGIERFRQEDTSQTTIVTGLDSAGAEVARMQLIHGRFDISPYFSDSNDGTSEEVDGRKLEVSLRGVPALQWETEGYAPILKMPAHPRGAVELARFMDDPHVSSVLAHWGIGFESAAQSDDEATYTSSSVAGTNVLTFGSVNVTEKYSPAPATFMGYGNAVASQGSITVPWPSHQVGDIGLLIVETSVSQPATLFNSPGWQLLTRSANNGINGTNLAVWWWRAYSNAMPSAVISDSGDHQLGQILIFRNVPSTGIPYLSATGTVGSSTTATIGGNTTMSDNELVVLISAHGVAGSMSGWSNPNLTSLVELTDRQTSWGDGGGFAVAAGTRATAGTISNTTATLSVQSPQAYVSLVFQSYKYRYGVVTHNNNTLSENTCGGGGAPPLLAARLDNNYVANSVTYPQHYVVQVCKPDATTNYTWLGVKTCGTTSAVSQCNADGTGAGACTACASYPVTTNDIYAMDVSASGLNYCYDSTTDVPTLTVNNADTGGDVEFINIDEPPLVDGQSTKTVRVCNNSNIVIHATPTTEIPAVFTGWSGACSGTDPTCVVPISGNVSVTASFSYL